MKELGKIEKTIGVKFKNKKLLQQAFIHRSYLNENKEFGEHNERLEFLGDAILELVVTEHLYRNFPNPEGELTNWRSALVKGETLSKVARELGFNDYLYLSKGEKKSEGKARDLILANCFEAVIGAIYLDSGIGAVETFIQKYILSKLEVILEKGLYIDAKSNFQELAQEKKGVTPHYHVLEEKGPDHAKEFKVGCYIGEEVVGIGVARSKQQAEQEAAEDALGKVKFD